MFDQELGEKTRIQPAGLLKSVDCRVLSLEPEVERGVSQREIKIDQHGALGRFLGQRYRKIAGDGGNTGAALGAEEYEQPAACLLQGVICRTAGRGPNHGLGHGAQGEWLSQEIWIG